MKKREIKFISPQAQNYLIISGGSKPQSEYKQAFSAPLLHRRRKHTFVNQRAAKRSAPRIRAQHQQELR